MQSRLLPALAQVLKPSTDELLGLEPPAAKRAGRPRDNRLQRRLQQIESLPPEERRQLIQIVDASSSAVSSSAAPAAASAAKRKSHEQKN
jgi:hypothetical protein